MTLLSAHRLRAIDQSACPDALATGRLAVVQPKPLGAPVAPRAYEPSLEAAVRKLPHTHADRVIEAAVTKPDMCRHRAARDVAMRHVH
jgi:hypothetical protein